MLYEKYYIKGLGVKNEYKKILLILETLTKYFRRILYFKMKKTTFVYFLLFKKILRRNTLVFYFISDILFDINLHMCSQP